VDIDVVRSRGSLPDDGMIQVTGGNLTSCEVAWLDGVKCCIHIAPNSTQMPSIL
jgi:hypothetical protein